MSAHTVGEIDTEGVIGGTGGAKDVESTTEGAGGTEGGAEYFEVSNNPITFVPLEELYTDLHQIGKGTYGTVYSGYDIKTKEEKALKLVRFNRTKLNPTLIAEMCLPHELDHKFIIQYDTVRYVSYNKNEYVCLVMAKYDSDLNTYIRKKKHFGPTYTHLQLMYNLALAVAQCTTKNIIHGDIKLENTVLNVDSKGEAIPDSIKLIDFSLGQTSTCTATNLYSSIYTLPERPPEVLFRDKYTPKTDVWALGCIFFSIVNGYHPFYDPNKSFNEGIFYNRLFRLRGDPRELYPNFTDSDLENVNRALADAGIKPTTWTPQVLFKGDRLINNLLEGMIRMNPLLRLNIFQVLNHPVFDDFKGAEVQKFESLNCTNITYLNYRKYNFLEWPANYKIGPKYRDYIQSWALNVSNKKLIGLDATFFGLELIDRVYSDSWQYMERSDLELMAISMLIIAANLKYDTFNVKTGSDVLQLTEVSSEDTQAKIVEYISRTLRDVQCKIGMASSYDFIKTIVDAYASVEYKPTVIRLCSIILMILILSKDIYKYDLAVAGRAIVLIGLLHFKDVNAKLLIHSKDNLTTTVKLLTHIKEYLSNEDRESTYEILTNFFHRLFPHDIKAVRGIINDTLIFVNTYIERQNRQNL